MTTHLAYLASILHKFLPEKSTIKAACLFSVPLYLLAVRYFRNYRRKSLERHFKHLFDNDGNIKPDAELNPLDAQKIVWSIGFYDFPFSYVKATEFALFKTYGIYTIAKLLCETGQLVGPCSDKRAEDTVLIFQEFIGQPLDSERCRIAIARMNWMHDKYKKKIPPETLLFTWAAVVVEISEWMKRFEWRPLTPLEEFGQFVFWREIGDRMGIPSEFVPKTHAELIAWYRKYENDHMKFSEESHHAGEGTVALMLSSIPLKSLHPYIRKAIIACLEDHLRVAMGFEEVSPAYYKAIIAFCRIRGFFMQYLTLPRYYRSQIAVSLEPDSRGRYIRYIYSFAPFYVPRTPKFILQGLLTGLMPSKEKYHSEGFILEQDVGPAYFQGKGVKEVKENAKNLPSSDKGARVGCPYSF